jgi:hypothetical protein
MKALLASALVLGLGACTSGKATDVADAAAGPHVGHSLASGTRVGATIQDPLSSRTNKAGDSLRAIVSREVADSRGAVVIPAGSSVMLTVAQLAPGRDSVRSQGRLSLVAISVTVNGRAYPLTAGLAPVPYHMEGRGLATDNSARLGAGAALGTATARHAYRDVIVSAGTPIVLTLNNALNLSAR